MAIEVATYGAKRGVCNLCGSQGLLTADHTPPKGCLRPTKVELKHIGQMLSSEEPRAKGRISQNGVKYRTLCSSCNNDFLGHRYDPALISFVNKVGDILKSSIYLPSIVEVEAQPQPLIRSLLGHMFAQGINRYGKHKNFDVVKEYFFDQTKPLPGCVSVYYWAHPYLSHVMIRDAAYLDIKASATFYFWLLKFFPIAFLMIWDGPNTLEYRLPSFNAWRSSEFESRINVPLRLRPTMDPFWPEAPSDNHVLLYGKEAITAQKIKPRK